MLEKRLHVYVSLYKTARSLGTRLNNQHISLVFKQFPWNPMQCVTDATPYDNIQLLTIEALDMM